KPKCLGILGFNGAKASHVVGVLEAFIAADAYSERQTRHFYDVKLLAFDGRSFVSEFGISIKTKHSISDFAAFDTIVIPGGNGVRAEVGQKIAQWVQNYHSAVRRIVMIGSGVYPVAHAGLLDGRKVASHWRLAQDLAARFANLRVDPGTSFIKDG